MALIAHWPLNGNTEDYTVNQNHGVNNGVTWVDGKIGQAGSFNGTTSKITVSQVDLLSEWSVSVWIKPVASTKTFQFLFGNNVITGNIGRILIRHNGYVTYSYPVHTYKKFSLLTEDIVGSWNHLVFVANNNGIDLYLNGVYNSTVNQVDPILNFAMIGNAWNDNNWATEGQINDVRIYNHALSEKEIYELSALSEKEIYELSLAKVLHYDFDNPFVEESDNLVSIRDINASALTVSLTNRALTPEGQLRITTGNYLGTYTFGSLRINVPLSVLEDGETYTMAVRYKEIAGNPNFSFMDWGDTPITQRTITDGPYKIAIGTGTRSVYSSTFRFMDCRMNPNSEILIYDVQLQKGDHYAEIVNGYREPGLIYDKSGYEHHGTQWTKRPRLSEDAALGSHSIEFDGADNTDAVQLGNVLNLREEISLSVWIKYGPTLSGGVFVRGNNEEWASNSYMFLRASGGAYRSSFSNGSEMLNYTLPSSLGDNEWHHIVATFDQDYLRFYIDGEQTYETANTIGLLNESNSLDTFLGAGYTTTVFDGLIDDMRVYAKALEAKDVEILYKTRASFDNTGNIFLEEISNTPEMKKALEVQPNGGSDAVDWAIDFKPNKDIIIKSALIRSYFTGDLTVTLRDGWYSTPVQEVTVPVTSGVVQRVELNIFCKKDQQVKLGRTNPSSTPLMRESTNTLISELSNEDIEFFPSSQVGGTSYADRIYYFFDWEYEIVDKININSTGTMTFNEINQIDHNLNQETTKQRLKEDGTLEIDGYIIQN